MHRLIIIWPTVNTSMCFKNADWVNVDSMLTCQLCQIRSLQTLYTHKSTGCPVCVFCLFPAAAQTVRPSGSLGTAGWERKKYGERERRRERPLQSYSNHMQMRHCTPHEKWIINHLAPLGQWEGKALITPSSKGGGEQAPRCVKRHRERCFPRILITQSYSPTKLTAWTVQPYSSCLIIYQ